MNFSLAPLAFFSLIVLLIAVPFLPGFFEWMRKKDAGPLRVVRKSEVDIRHFAMGFRSLLETKLAGEVLACRETGESREGVLENGTPYLIVKDEHAPILSASEENAHSAQRMILSCGDLDLPAETMFLPELYAAGSVRGGEKNIYRAILAEKAIYLKKDSMSLRWLHACSLVQVESGAVLYGRVSADKAIMLDGDCRFERLHAPLIEFGPNHENWKAVFTETENSEKAEFKAEDIPNLVENAGNRLLIEGKLEIPSRRVVEENLVVTGQLKIGSSTSIHGNLKCRKDIRLEGGVEVKGSLVSGHDIHIGQGCSVQGPVLAEGDIFLEGGTIIGMEEHATTVSAGSIYIAPGTIVYGTVWAHQQAQLRPAGASSPSDPAFQRTST
jgi:hypothetical protein